MGCGAGSPAPCPELTSGYSFHRYTGTYPIEKQLDVCKALFFFNTLLIENKTKKISSPLTELARSIHVA